MYVTHTQLQNDSKVLKKRDIKQDWKAVGTPCSTLKFKLCCARHIASVDISGATNGIIIATVV